MKKLVLLAALAALCLALAPVSYAGAIPVIWVDNESTTVSDQDVAAALPAFQIAVSRDLASVWGTDALFTTDPTVPHQMEVDLVDQPPCWSCFGYHTVELGIPTSIIGVGVSAQQGEAWSLVFMHEVDEMLVDPWVNRMARWNGSWWLVEVADPCEDGMYAYFVDGWAVSDFITPRFYDSSLVGPFDFTRHFKRAGQLGRHGYKSYWGNGTWQQVYNG